jgi:hypothetical protein
LFLRPLHDVWTFCVDDHHFVHVVALRADPDRSPAHAGGLVAALAGFMVGSRGSVPCSSASSLSWKGNVGIMLWIMSVSTCSKPLRVCLGTTHQILWYVRRELRDVISYYQSG